jgi:hypothetical protein
MHWVGLSWNLVLKPVPGRTILEGVAATAACDVLAVGYGGNYPAIQGQTLHWNGSSWVRVVNAEGLSAPNYLYGVTARAGEVWAAGAQVRDSIHTDTATLHYTNPCATPGPTPTACPITFSDVQASDYFYTPVQYLACRGVVSGYSDGSFRPYNPTTRGQLSKIVTLGFNLPITTPGGDPTFVDVPPRDVFYPYVETLAATGTISGYPCGSTNPETGAAEPCSATNQPYFRGNNKLTRGQLTKIVVLTAQHQYGWAVLTPANPTFPDVPVGSTFYSYVETAVCHGVLSGFADGTFKPSNNATRGQIAKIAYNALTGPAAICFNGAAARAGK